MMTMSFGLLRIQSCALGITWRESMVSLVNLVEVDLNMSHIKLTQILKLTKNI